MIQLFKTVLHEESIRYANEVMRSGWLGLGPWTEKFEREFAQYIGCKHAIAMNSGTAALYLAVELAKIPKSSRVISTPLTFVASNHVLLQHQLDPIFADIDITTGNIDLNSVSKLLHLMGPPSEHNTTRPRAIMAVHYGGQPLDLDWLYSLAKEYKLTVIEDAAHACGASWNGEFVGQRSQFACFSFHAVKNLSMADGGMLCTNDDEIAEKARKLRWFGITKNTAERSQEKYSWEYGVDGVGYKSHGNDVMSAIGLGQLHHLNEGNTRRKEIYEIYRNAGLPMTLHQGGSSHHLAVMLAEDKVEKERIQHALTNRDIQFGCHYTPNYYYSMYYDCLRHLGCVNVEEFYSKCLSLPNHLALTDNDLKEVINVILNVRR